MKRFLTVAALVALFGAGCLPDLTALPTAEPLTERSAEAPIAQLNGFGTLPNIPAASGGAVIALAKPLPALPDRVTVLRPRSGTPNDTEFLNLANSLGISDGFIGTRADVHEMNLDWTDDTGFHWTYRGSTRLLEFADDHAPSEPVTVATLPANDAIAHIANTFLNERGIALSRFREPIVEPDWNAWWTDAQATHRCVDQKSLATIRAVAASTPSQIGAPPGLPDAGSTNCLSPEFPARLTVRYRLVVDGRDVVRSDGSFVNGAEVTVDVSRGKAVSGQLILATDPDRSDYTAVNAAQAEALLKNGGVTGVTGAVSITAYDFASLRVADTYLIPSLIAIGTRTRPDGTPEQIRIVVPLVAGH